MPSPFSTWQFNLSFDLENELHNHTSISLLRSSGIDFEKLKSKGINARYFAEKITSSGLIINANIKWVCFHGCYDFAYLLRLSMNEDLPLTYQNFLYYMKTFFPTIYDIKSFSSEIDEYYEGGGLNKLSD